MERISLVPEKVNVLQKLLSEAFSEGWTDYEKFRASLGEQINFSNERYMLNWAWKSVAFKVIETPTTKSLVLL